jgi:hypothetical protein
MGFLGSRKKSLLAGILGCGGTDEEVRSAIGAMPLPWNALVLHDFALSETFCREIAGHHPFTSLSVFSGKVGFRHDNVVGLFHPRLRQIHLNHLTFSETPTHSTASAARLKISISATPISTNRP